MVKRNHLKLIKESDFYILSDDILINFYPRVSYISYRKTRYL